MVLGSADPTCKSRRAREELPSNDKYKGVLLRAMEFGFAEPPIYRISDGWDSNVKEYEIKAIAEVRMRMLYGRNTLLDSAIAMTLIECLDESQIYQ